MPEPPAVGHELRAGLGRLASPPVERIELWPNPPDDPAGTPFIVPGALGGIHAVRAVSRPTILSSKVGGRGSDTGVVICPGGAMLFVSTGNEGTPLAAWMNDRGLSAHVLEYRTLPTVSDDEPGVRFSTGFADGSLERDIGAHVETAAADVADAVRWARDRHEKVVVLSFSAGAIATMAAIVMFGLQVDAAAAVYLPQFPVLPVPADAPPLFVAAAVDDPLGIDGSTNLLQGWRAASRPVELHLFEGGGHGFGLGLPGTTSDGWVDLFRTWLRTHDLVS